tara:strand:+ start:199 stop:306 length:108 start_codon:yes stop_codon:yes gene_type:complete
MKRDAAAKTQDRISLNKRASPVFIDISVRIAQRVR